MTTITPTPQKLSLYDMCASAQEAMAELNDLNEDEEISPQERATRIAAVLERLGQAQDLIPQKVSSVIGFVRTEKYRADMVRREITRLKAKVEVHERNIESTENGYLLPCLKMMPDGKYKDHLFSAYVGKSKSVDIIDEEALGDAWCRITREPAKDVIKAALKDGIEVTGARLKENESVQIR